MNDNELYLIGLIASVVVWVLKKFVERQVEVPKAVVTIGLYAVSLLLAVWWMGFQLPPIAGDISEIVQAYLHWVGGYVAFAILIYQVLLKRVLDQWLPAAWRKLA